ncbi:hypothetical protein FA13DRAFT_1747478 [Coprinellus micaceus]|uniref:Uncharacterized protein n=1 Tax=Coprinellus micaceus TaxID=71717 RepID=A0A4Y7S2W2_COPMI|nr:hypothetical protein FA13DRAFT_1747478 [Coprinellus micaceus]
MPPCLTAHEALPFSVPFVDTPIHLSLFYHSIHSLQHTSTRSVAISVDRR